MEQTVLSVSGMSCQHCVKAVTSACKSVKGVKKVKVDLAAGSASFAYDGDTATLAAVKSAITEQGFEVN